jgi:hypothetical protein
MKTKWVGGVAQVVECLLWKHKALSSNPIPKKKKEKQRKKRVCSGASFEVCIEGKGEDQQESEDSEEFGIDEKG